MSFSKKIVHNEQANLITAWIEKETEDTHAWVAVLNQSNFPVYKMILTTVNVQVNASDGREAPNDFRFFLKVAPPGKHYIKTLIHHGMGFSSGIEIAFTDKDNAHWVRSGNNILVKINETPVEYYGLALPLSWDYPLERPV